MMILSYYSDAKERNPMDGRVGGAWVLSLSEYCYILL
jgi:hypothetical protein